MRNRRLSGDRGSRSASHFLCLSAVWGSLLLSGLAFAGAPEDPRTLRPQQAAVPPAAQEARVALVIGNGAYRDAPLRNPVNDARGMAEALRQCGFVVAELENVSREAMFRALREFGDRIKGGGIGLFYFAGHGMQVKGRNYLIPVGMDIAREDEVPAQALEVDLVLAKMDSAGSRLNVMILDACRNNPFGSAFRGGNSGLAQMDAPAGTYISFATAPGRTAADGNGANGLYTQHLLANLRTPGLKLEDLFKQVRSGVLRDSAKAQMPWDSSSLTGDFYFVPGNGSPVVGNADPAPSPVRNDSEPWKLLVRDGFESQAEFDRRIKALPTLRLGRAVPQREAYDLDRKRLPMVLEPEAWARPFLNMGKVVLVVDKEQARTLCTSGGDLALEGRFTTVGSKVVCSRLEAVSSIGRFVLTRPATFAVGDKDEVDLGKGERLILAFIPSGSFRMGSATGRSNERPVHDVTISRSFWMGAYPVTQAQWQVVMGSNPSYFKGPDLPVENVNWDDCQQFISRVNAMGVGTFRLPTEAEWEHACRAGSTGETHENLVANAWYWDNSGKTTHPVGQKQANAWGLYDMTGNVTEWCQDWYGKSYYHDSPSGDPQGPPSGSDRVRRGGSFVHEAHRIRYAYRDGGPQIVHGYDLGFRIVRTEP